jgi:N-carbamoylputrescine amidase
MSAIQENVKVIRVAAVQMQSQLGQTKANLDHAKLLAEQAARGGAQLIAFPELSASGYSMSPLIWEWAETRGGCTVHWVRETSRRLGVYLGMGFVETDGKDLFNTYVLGVPDGQVAGYVRKTMAETACFKCFDGSHVVDTPIGHIGIGICADNLFVPNLHRMQDHSADLLLMPHAAPLPFKKGGLVSDEDLSRSRCTLSQMASNYARLIGIPAVFINQVGPRGLEKWFGIIGSLMGPDAFYLGGLSTISDPDGNILGQLDEQKEGVILSDVTLDESRKIKTRPVGHGTYGGGFVTPHPLLFEGICYVDAFFGRLSYSLSPKRRKVARAIALA